MPRKTLRYGHKVILVCNGGFVVATNSALAPVGVRQETPEAPIAFENAIFTLSPGEGDFDPFASRTIGDEVKFGQVVRLIHNTQHSPLVHSSKDHAVLDKAAQKVSLEQIEPSKKDSSKVQLTRTDRWRVLPKYRVRGEGERVCEGDHLIFQSMMSTSSFLAVSSLRDDRTDGCFELQCSQDPSGVEVHFYDAEENADTSAIRGGHCVVLLHREENRKLMVRAETNDCLLDAKQTIVQDPIQKKANNYENLFIVEFDDRAKAGVVVMESKQLYRLKSVSSSSYLCVARNADRTLHVTTTRDVSDEGSLFALHPAGDDTGETVKSGTRLFLEVPAHQAWIQSGSSFTDADKKETPFLTLACSSSMNAKDGFEVQRLGFEEYRDLSSILSLLPPLRSFPGAMEAGQIDSSMIAQVSGNLYQLRRMCFQERPRDQLIDLASEEDGVIDIGGQHRLLTQGVGTLCVRISQSVINSTFVKNELLISNSNEDVTTLLGKTTMEVEGGPHAGESHLTPVRYSDLVDLVALCLSTVQAIVRDNINAARELNPILPLVVNCCEVFPAAISCVTEFLRGNVELAQDLADGGNKELVYFLDLLEKKPRDAALVQLVALFAASRDEGFMEAQRIIRQHLLEDTERRDSIFLRIVPSATAPNDPWQAMIEVPEFNLTNKIVSKYKVSRKNGSEALRLIPFSELVEVTATGRSKGRPSIIPLIAKQIHLLASLCAGGNSESAEIVLSFVPKELLLPLCVANNCRKPNATAKDHDPEPLPILIHAEFVTLYCNTSVKVRGALNLSSHLRNIRFVIDDPKDEAFRLEVPIQLPELNTVKQYVIKFLDDGGGSMSSNEGAREQLDAVARLTSGLLQRGYLSFAEYRSVSHSIVAFLDQRNDVATNDPEVFRDKVILVGVLNMFIDIVLSNGVGSLAQKFAKEGLDAQIPSISQLIDLGDPLTSVRALDTEELLEAVSANSAEAHGTAHPLFEVRYVLDVLIDIARVNNWPLQSQAIRLFCRLCNQHAEFIKILQRIQVTTKDSSNVYDATKRFSDGIARYIMTRKNAAECSKHVVGLVEQIMPGGVTLEGEALRHVITIQKNLAIAPALIQVLGDMQSVRQRTNDSGLTDLSEKCLSALQVLASNDVAVREVVAKSFERLTFLATPCRRDYLSLAQAVFVDSQFVFDLSGSVVNEIVNSVEYDSEAVKLIHLILGIKDAGNKYINKNQLMIWKALIANKVTSKMMKLNGVWTGQKGSSLRDRVIAKAETDNSVKSEIRNHLEFLDVVFLAAKQNDLLKPEEVRYELFRSSGVEDFLELLSSKSVPSYFRYTYINLFQVLVIEDVTCLGAVFTHKKLQMFLSNCLRDVSHLSDLLTGKVERSERNAEGSPVQDFGNPTPRAVVDPRIDSIQFNGEFVSLAVLPCLRHIIINFSSLATRVSPKVRAVLTNGINDIVDAVAELADLMYNDNNKSKMPALVFGDATMPRKKTRDFIKTAGENDFFGSSSKWVDTLDLIVGKIDADLKGESDHEDDSKSKKKEQSLERGSLLVAWDEFLSRIKDSFAQSPESQFASAAGFILRSGTEGSEFLKVLIKSLPFLDCDVETSVLDIVRQVVDLTEECPSDGSRLLPFDVIEADLKALSIQREKEERQKRLSTILRNASSSSQVLPVVVDLISSKNHEVRDAATRTALALLDGGHIDMQMVLYDSVRERGDEEIFVYLRDEFVGLQEIILTYIRVVQRGADPRDLLDDIGYFEALLRLVQLFCEGHFTPLQDYLRTQPLNIVSVNVIESLCELLSVVVKVIDVKTVDLLIQLLRTICETMQGPCKQNQDFYVSANISDHLIIIITIDENGISSATEASNLSSIESKKLIRVMKLKALECLLALVEGRTEKSYISTLVSSIDLKLLTSAMDASAELYEERRGPMEDGGDENEGMLLYLGRLFLSYAAPVRVDDEIDDELAPAISIFVFLKSILDHQHLAQKQVGMSNFEFTGKSGKSIKYSLKRSKSFRAVNRKVGMVEIVRHGELERTYFRILDSSSKNLKESTKEELIKTVDRSSDNKRLHNFLELSGQIIAEMEFYSLLRSIPFVALFQDLNGVLDTVTLVVSFVINLLLLVVEEAPNNPFDSPITSAERSALNGLGILLIALQSMLLVNYLIGPARVHVQSCLLEWVNAHMQSAIDDSRANLSIEDPVFEHTEVSTLPHWRKAVQGVWYTLQHGQFQRCVLYLVAAVLGYVQSNIWYTVHLLHITNKSPVLYNVLLAVTTNGVSLILTLILLLIVIYMFGTVSYYHFSELMDPNKVGNGYDCSSLAGCWFTHIDAIRAGGGIGDVSTNPYFDPINPIGYTFAFFKLLFFVIVIIIFLNIVFGIIVDSFAQLREERESIDTDQLTKCFICGIEQNEFDRLTPGGFEQHVKTEHNMWHYLYFLHYLKKKNPEDFNGQEADVFQKAEINETTFFPIGKAMTIAAAVETEGDDVSAKVETLSKSIEAVGVQCSGVEERLNNISENILNELAEIRKLMKK